jgi:selenide, water dikinase
VAGFPSSLSVEAIAQIFAGGAVKVREAGAAIAGGHTITSPEPFYGLSVTGLIHPDEVMSKGGARPGDRLYLTKPLGTGIVTTAAKRTGPGESPADRATRRAQGGIDLNLDHLDAAIASMLHLNRAAAQAARLTGVRGATDITGFGLLGHACEMLVAAQRWSEAGFVLRAADVPALPGVWDYIAAGYTTSGSARNPTYFGAHVHFADAVTAAQRTLLWEVETSGGLLLAVPPAIERGFVSACGERNQPIWAIGAVINGQGLQVI